jgi:alcohol dehydrogenase, propanol-preferring
MNIPATNRAIRLHAAGAPLVAETIPLPALEPEQILLRVAACGVCRTDLHIVDGELPDVRHPVVPGHEIVGVVVARGSRVTRFEAGARAGVPWLGYTCGACRYCRSGLENLCERALFTGCTLDGGYAEYVVADARYCVALPSAYDDADTAPLLCAGLIGYRAYRAAVDAERLGLYGFGAAAHLLAQVAHYDGRHVYAFTRPGDEGAQAFARALGAAWVGGSDTPPPDELDAAIIFAPVGALVPAALRATRKGGRVVCAGIHMSDIPAFPYRLLWGERSVSSVANLTRADAEDFMRVATRVPLRPEVERFPLTAANEALARLRAGTLRGAAVLVP